MAESTRCRRELNATVLLSYLADLQFVLLAISAAWSAVILRIDYRGRTGRPACSSPQIWSLNIIFFMTHPVFTPYYTVPISMLSLWTLLFATLKPYGETVADKSAPATTG